MNVMIRLRTSSVRYASNWYAPLFASAALVLTLSGCSEGPLAASWASGAIGVGSGNILDNSYQTAAVAILTAKCTGCHGSASSGGVTNITDVSHLVASGLIVPGNAAGSQLYTAITSRGMPQGGTIAASEISTLQNWINGNGTTGTPFTTLEASIFQVSCTSCHSGASPANGVDLSSFTAVMAANIVSTGSPSTSPLYTTAYASISTPHHGASLTSDQVNQILSWIQAGAPNN